MEISPHLAQTPKNPKTVVASNNWSESGSSSCGMVTPLHLDLPWYCWIWCYGSHLLLGNKQQGFSPQEGKQENFSGTKSLTDRRTEKGRNPDGKQLAAFFAVALGERVDKLERQSSDHQEDRHKTSHLSLGSGLQGGWYGNNTPPRSQELMEEEGSGRWGGGRGTGSRPWPTNRWFPEKTEVGSHEVEIFCYWHFRYLHFTPFCDSFDFNSIKCFFLLLTFWKNVCYFCIFFLFLQNQKEQPTYCQCSYIVIVLLLKVALSKKWTRRIVLEKLDLGVSAQYIFSTPKNKHVKNK